MIRRAVLAFALLTACPKADAQPQFEPNMQVLDVCRDGPASSTSTGTAICAREATDATDRRIAALIGEARLPGLALRGADLSASQTNWQRYRDLHCGLFDRGDGSSGSQTPADVQLCRLARSLRREAELRELIYLMGPR
jgi:uncharacterized protein YecT (DUF1311 family)